jgi:hypothetical protein
MPCDRGQRHPRRSRLCVYSLEPVPDGPVSRLQRRFLLVSVTRSLVSASRQANGVPGPLLENICLLELGIEGCLTPRVRGRRSLGGAMGVFYGGFLRRSAKLLDRESFLTHRADSFVPHSTR